MTARIGTVVLAIVAGLGLFSPTATSQEDESTAQCVDGTYSAAQTRAEACVDHGGVSRFFGPLAAQGGPCPEGGCKPLARGITPQVTTPSAARDVGAPAAGGPNPAPGAGSPTPAASPNPAPAAGSPNPSPGAGSPNPAPAAGSPNPSPGAANPNPAVGSPNPANPNPAVGGSNPAPGSVATPSPAAPGPAGATSQPGAPSPGTGAATGFAGPSSAPGAAADGRVIGAPARTGVDSQTLGLLGLAALLGGWALVSIANTHQLARQPQVRRR